jgi:hypothetical protein
VYKDTPRLKGYTVTVSSYRKGQNGNTGVNRPTDAGRKGKTGKKAVVRNMDGDLIEQFKEATFKALATRLRKNYNIHPNIAIAKKGVTKF